MTDDLNKLSDDGGLVRHSDMRQPHYRGSDPNRPGCGVYSTKCNAADRQSRFRMTIQTSHIEINDESRIMTGYKPKLDSHLIGCAKK